MAARDLLKMLGIESRTEEATKVVEQLHAHRDGLRELADKIQGDEPRAANELRLAANIIATQAKRLWSL